MRTNVPHIFAIGDVVGQPMLAHKATHEGKLAAEVAAGEKSEWVARVIPCVAYTDPEVAWVGVTETEAKAKGLEVGVGKFPWAASGRAIGIGRTEGFTKLVFDEASHRVIGAGIVGVHAGDLISEIALAIEMGCEAADIGHTIHPHPDPERIGRHGGGSVRGHDHRSLHSEEEITIIVASPSRASTELHAMPKLYDASDDSLLGTIAHEEVDQLVAQLAGYLAPRTRLLHQPRQLR